MTKLSIDHPDGYVQLEHGGFSVQLGRQNPFSRIQVNQTIKETVNKDTPRVAKSTHKETILKADHKLFGHMVLIATSRKLDMRSVLVHPLGLSPWSPVNCDDTLKKTSKSTLARQLENNVSLAERILHLSTCIRRTGSTKTHLPSWEKNGQCQDTSSAYSKSFHVSCMLPDAQALLQTSYGINYSEPRKERSSQDSFLLVKIASSCTVFVQPTRLQCDAVLLKSVPESPTQVVMSGAMKITYNLLDHKISCPRCHHRVFILQVHLRLQAA